MLKLFATRDKSGLLRLWTGDDLIKNRGQGHWLPEYNSRTQGFPIDQSELPSVRWEDVKPKSLIVTTLEDSEDNIENVRLPGTIEVDIDNAASNYNVNRGSTATLFVDDISYIDDYFEEPFKSVIHMKNGNALKCIESARRVKQLIGKSRPQ